MSSKYDYIFKIILVGDANTGKSNTILRFSEGVFRPQYTSTIGADLSFRTIDIDGKVIKAQIWDTAGQERFTTFPTNYYRGAAGVILFYNIDKRQSFESLGNWLDEIRCRANENVVKLLIGNKYDLEENRQVSYDEAKAYADYVGMQYFETSAKTGENVEEAFFWIISEIKKKLELEEHKDALERGNEKADDKKVILAKKPDEKQRRCC